MDPLQVLRINLLLPIQTLIKSIYRFCFMAWQCMLIVFLFFNLLSELQAIIYSIWGGEIKKSKNFNYEGPNKISDLPDVIIGRILFFLPTKEAISTSVLSKRWIYLWTFITKLEFEHTDIFSQKIRIWETLFYNFVDKVLLHLTRVKSSKVSLFILQRIIIIVVLISGYIIL